MKKQLFLSIVLAIVCLNCSAQSSSHIEGQTSFFAEVGGPGILFSANLDRRFTPSSLGIGGRIGVGFVSSYEDYYDPNFPNNYYGGRQVSVITVPVQLNYVFGKPNSPHAFEVGGGLTWIGKKLDVFNFYDNQRTNLFGTFSFMYRRQPRNGGFSWRLGFTPLIARSYIQPSAAVSVGYNF